MFTLAQLIQASWLATFGGTALNSGVADSGIVSFLQQNGSQVIDDPVTGASYRVILYGAAPGYRIIPA